MSNIYDFDGNMRGDHQKPLKKAFSFNYNPNPSAPSYPSFVDCRAMALPVYNLTAL
jgi:hypothetical protein